MLNWTVVNRATVDTLKSTLPQDEYKDIAVCVQEIPGFVEFDSIMDYDDFYSFFDRWPNTEMAWAYINLPSPWYITPKDLK